jgi:hypothetical protein
MTQLRQAYQHDGQQKSVVELEIRQQSELLEGFHVYNHLRFIHDQYRADPTLRIRCIRSLSVRNRPAFDRTSSSPN